jgi:hypothetical protein
MLRDYIASYIYVRGPENAFPTGRKGHRNMEPVPGIKPHLPSPPPNSACFSFFYCVSLPPLLHLTSFSSFLSYPCPFPFPFLPTVSLTFHSLLIQFIHLPLAIFLISPPPPNLSLSFILFSLFSGSPTKCRSNKRRK